MSPEEIVRAYWKEMESNVYSRAAEFLSEDYICLWPQSSEIIKGRDNFIKINSHYPSNGIWQFTINSLICQGNEVVTDVSVTDGTAKARAITFHTIRNGAIAEQKEFWPDDYEAPEWRKEWVQISK